MHSLSTKIFPKTKRGGAKNGQSPLLIRSEMEISNRGQMPNKNITTGYTVTLITQTNND